MFRFLIVICLVAAIVVACDKSGSSPISSSPTTKGVVIAAAGDIACGSKSGGANCKQMETSDLLMQINPDAVLTLGDNQYECGELANFDAFYAPSWGRLEARTKPAPGNHEYNTSCQNSVPGAPGYYTYFGALASPDDPTCTVNCRGYYSFDLGVWHIVSLNSNCSHSTHSCDAGGSEVVWLQDDLAKHSNKCTLAYFHHPRWSSGKHGDQTAVSTIYQVLYQNNVDVVLAGHDHDYERLAPTDPNGNLDTARGIVNFVVGTGGRNHTGRGPSTVATSQVFDSTSFGVLELTLHPTSYDWRFVAAAGQSFTDSSSQSCH